MGDDGKINPAGAPTAVGVDEPVESQTQDLSGAPDSGPTVQTDVYSEGPLAPPVAALEPPLPPIARGGVEYNVAQLKEARRLADSTDYSPEGLLEILKRQKALAPLWSVVVVPNEGFSLERHTLLVLGLFERTFSGRIFPPEFNRGLFRIVLATHDIGKPLVVQAGEGRKESEHEHTGRLVREILGLMGYGEREIHFALALINGKFGQYVHAVRIGYRTSDAMAKGDAMRMGLYETAVREKLGLTRAEAEECWRDLVERRDGRRLVEYAGRNALADLRIQSRRIGLSMSELLGYQEIYYLCDAGSYTTAANGGVPQLAAHGRSAFDDLFVFDDEPVPSVRFANLYLPSITALKNTVVSLERGDQAGSPIPTARSGPRSGEGSVIGGDGSFVTVGSLALRHEPAVAPDSGDEAKGRPGEGGGVPSASLKRRLMAVATEHKLGAVTRLMAGMTDRDLERVVRGGRGLAKILLAKRGHGELVPAVDGLRMTETVFLSLALMAKSDSEIAKIVGDTPSHSGTGTAAVQSLAATAPTLLSSPSSVLHVLR